MGWYGNDDQVHWFGWIMMAGWIALVIAAIAAGSYVLLRNRRVTGPASAAGARQILDMRFARGEIDGEEYRLRRDALAESPPS